MLGPVYWILEKLDLILSWWERVSKLAYVQWGVTAVSFYVSSTLAWLTERPLLDLVTIACLMSVGLTYLFTHVPPLLRKITRRKTPDPVRTREPQDVHLIQPPPVPQKEPNTDPRPQWERIDDTLRDILLSPMAPHSPQARYSFIQRHAETLRQELKDAAPEDKLHIIDKLIRTLEQQIQLLGDVFQRPETQYQEHYNSIVREIGELRDLSKRLNP